MQEKYGFKARTYNAAGFANVAEYKKVHGSDLFIRDIEEYDKICKVRMSHSISSATAKEWEAGRMSVFPDCSMVIHKCMNWQGHIIGDMLHCTSVHNGCDVCAIEHKVMLCLLQVEPFQRSLKDMDVDVMINGRRRDHGFERAQLEVRHSLPVLCDAATCR